MRHVDDQERRARLARRHGIDPARRATDAVAATRAMTVLHATEAPSVYLSLHARVDGLTVADVDRVLYEERTLVKQMAMRRTLFVFPRDLLPAAWGSASARVTETEWRRMAKEIAAAWPGTDGEAWLEAACTAVLERLATDGPMSTQHLRAGVPEIAGTITMAPGKKWGGEVPMAPRVLTLLGARGQIVRARNAGHWRISRPAWTRTADWLGEEPPALTAPAGYAELARRWLWTFGPASVGDLTWWLGSTVTAARQALADIGAVEITVETGPAFVLPDDLDPVEPVEPWAALLPILDPTVMGWKQRDFYIGPHAGQLFDTNGNAGTTAWWDGRVVGGWVQDADGVVQVRLLEEIGSDASAALAREADRLTSWLAGERVSTVYPSPLMRAPA